jgi:branched-chain amino acid aminotransferase
MPAANVYEEQLFEAITASGLSSGYVRVIVTRGCGTLGINPSACSQPQLIMIVAALSLYPDDLYRSGVDVICAKTRKVPRSCFDGQVKACNYLNHIMATWEFVDAGASEALMLDCDGYVSEVTVANVFGIKGDLLFTPHLDTNCLNGITRRKVMEIAPEQGLSLEEGKYTIDKFIMADEVFLTGTGAGVMPVSSIAGRPLGFGRIGARTALLRGTFESRVAEWSTPCRAS